MSTDASGLVTTAPAGTLSNNTSATIALGRSAEQLTTQLHGSYYTAALAGKVFMMNTAAAGTVIPIQATNLVSTFTLVNPLTSNVNIELISYSVSTINATTVAADVSIYWQAGIGNANAALSSTTALSTVSTILGGSASPSALGYSAATFTNTVGTNFFKGPTMVSFGATTDTAAGVLNYEFNGKVILPPGVGITTAGSHAQTQAMVQSIFWAEWPA
jgi:hypothetical protein